MLMGICRLIILMARIIIESGKNKICGTAYPVPEIFADLLAFLLKRWYISQNIVFHSY